MAQPGFYPPCPPIFTAAHRQRFAVIYIRQSSPFQVQHNTGSTARQYDLYDLAVQSGWAPEQIVVVDDDLGVSGSKSGVRLGFPQMLQMVTTGRVSAVFTVHADRLARNLLEFAQIITVCEQSQTVLVLDGEVKDLSAGGDRLLTVMMGIFAEYENRDRTQKLRGSLLAKIRVHHEALGTPPAGYEAPVDATAPSQRRRRWGTQWTKSADPPVGAALDRVFSAFRLQGTVGAVVREFRRQGWQIPCRVMKGPRYGTVEFFPPTHARIRAVLKNPNFTDAYVYAKSEQHITGRLRQDGSGPLKAARRPPDQ